MFHTFTKKYIGAAGLAAILERFYPLESPFISEALIYLLYYTLVVLEESTYELFYTFSVSERAKEPAKVESLESYIVTVQPVLMRAGYSSSSKDIFIAVTS